MRIDKNAAISFSAIGDKRARRKLKRFSRSTLRYNYIYGKQQASHK